MKIVEPFSEPTENEAEVGLIDDEGFATYSEFLEKHQDELEELVTLWSARELLMNGRLVHEPTPDGKKWMPVRWLNRLKSNRSTREITKDFLPIMTDKLAPMSRRMHELCILLNLPYWEVERPAEQPDAVEPMLLKDAPKTRCGLCGAFAYQKSVLDAKRDRKNIPYVRSDDTVWVCEGCGAEAVVGINPQS